MENNTSNEYITPSSYMAIRNNLFNEMEKDKQISSLIVGFMLKVKEVINSKKDKHLTVENVTKRIDNYQKLFTNMKENNIIILNEPSK